MKKEDPALTFSYPRLLAAIYFGLLSVVGTILTNALVTSIGVEEIIPVFQAIILGMIVASCTGALFGEMIVHCKKPYKVKTFLIGFFMVLASLPVFDLGLLYFMEESNTKLFSLVKFHDIVITYFIILGYSYILFGFILAICAGLASMYLRGQLIYDILYSDEQQRKRKEREAKHALEQSKKAEHHKAHASHR